MEMMTMNIKNETNFDIVKGTMPTIRAFDNGNSELE